MDYIKIGKIVNTHGIKGEVRLLSKFPYKDKVFVKDMNIYIDKKDISRTIIGFAPYARHQKGPPSPACEDALLVHPRGNSPAS